VNNVNHQIVLVSTVHIKFFYQIGEATGTHFGPYQQN